MFLKRNESSEMMSFQIVGAKLQPAQTWAFGSSFKAVFKAWVERFVLQTVPHGYSDDQTKVPKYLFVFCSGR